MRMLYSTGVADILELVHQNSCHQVSFSPSSLARMRLLYLPNEILIQIAQRLDDAASINAFSRTCRHLYETLRFVLYAHNIQYDNSSALRWAADNNQLQTARYLIERGACLNVQSDGNLQTALIIATAKGFSGFVELLLDNGANTEIQDKMGNTAIFEAVRRQDQFLVQTLLEHGANPNATNHSGMTPLHCASRNARITELLLSAGARTDIGDFLNTTPLHFSVMFEKLDVVVILLKKWSQSGNPISAYWRNTFA